MNSRCLVLDGDRVHTAALSSLAEQTGYRVHPADNLAAALELVQGGGLDLVFLALDLPGGEDGLQLLENADLDGAEVIVMGDADDPLRADRAIRLGASYFFCKPFDEHSLGGMLRDIAAEFAADAQRPPDGASVPGVDQFGYLRGSSRSMRKLYRQLRKLAPTDTSVLVYGESGTGKELVARTVHALSPRSEGPFIAFNCAAIAPTLLESELFGHEKGSFSGAARQHRGFFERAHGGTLLLDEVTEMDLELQAKLLRVLETRSVRPVGSEREIAVDVRLVSTTNRPPQQAVDDGVFREDLYYRLAQFPLSLPALRRRGDDIAGLAQYFLNELNAHHGTELYFEEEALARIAGSPWPGNVRQLKHAVERAYILSEYAIGAAAFDVELPEGEGATVVGDVVEIPVGTSLADSEREIILATLDKFDGDKSAAAEALGISLKTLYNRLNRYESEE
ncbi:sigma-54-dependent transcriptional regulator [Mangrovimicrobium sediminis]|uniref:sigma-54-dependent transcriptional regulator n=1 Tax=Mangrovimicrobium sediminis TaxID=2562682 RepID=UPI001436CB66|nr:sigma-54 dependent transcriptional regulator [Haliea sp. SAOS-164]